MRFKLSVAVCTFNRAPLLKQVLVSLTQQTIEPDSLEVLIVDNNSTDETAEIARQFCLAYSNFKYYHERQQGLSHARNRAWKESTARYIAYIDDDAIADAEWCERIVSAFELIQPTPIVVGGIICPMYKTMKPKWFSDSFEMRSWGKIPRFIAGASAKFGFSGSNMAIERHLLERLGGFSPALGMKGVTFGLGEEADLFARAWKLDPGRFWYDPTISVSHLVPAENMRLSYQLSRMFSSGKTGALIANTAPSGWAYLRKIARLFKILFLAPINIIESNLGLRSAIISEARKFMYSLGWAVSWTPVVIKHVVRKRRTRLDELIAQLSRPVRQARETSRYQNVAVEPNTRFFIVSCGRNTGTSILKCLDSVYLQDFDHSRIRHLVIDDASDDGTCKIIEEWLQAHPGHSVELRKNKNRVGGTANTRHAFRAADSKSIVLELNADDWLADESVLSFLSKVYRDAQVWMTYNSFAYSNGSNSERRRPYPAYVVKNALYRDYEWICQHLHSFRAALLRHLPDDVFFDPETGGHLSNADDRSIYWSLLELCGSRAIHLERIMYIYDFHDNTDLKTDPQGSQQNVLKIQRMRRFNQLDVL